MKTSKVCVAVLSIISLILPVTCASSSSNAASDKTMVNLVTLQRTNVTKCKEVDPKAQKSKTQKTSSKSNPAKADPTKPDPTKPEDKTDKDETTKADEILYTPAEITVKYTLNFEVPGLKEASGNHLFLQNFANAQEFDNIKYVIKYTKGDKAESGTASIETVLQPKEKLTASDLKDAKSEIPIVLCIKPEEIMTIRENFEKKEIGDKYSIVASNVNVSRIKKGTTDFLKTDVFKDSLYTESYSVKELLDALPNGESEGFLSRYWIFIVISCIIVVAICGVTGFLVSKNKP